MILSRTVFLATLLAASLPAMGDAAHDRIAAERAAANAKLAEQEKECNTRFVVASCLENAREESRATLARLRHEQIELDDERRRATAEARRKEIADKAAAQQSRASEAATEDSRDGAGRDAPRAKPPALIHPPARAVPTPHGMPASGVSRAEQERINAENYELRQKKADAHRDTVNRRNAERASQGKAATPLPVPSSVPP